MRRRAACWLVPLAMATTVQGAEASVGGSGGQSGAGSGAGSCAVGPLNSTSTWQVTTSSVALHCLDTGGRTIDKTGVTRRSGGGTSASIQPGSPCPDYNWTYTEAVKLTPGPDEGPRTAQLQLPADDTMPNRWTSDTIPPIDDLTPSTTRNSL